MKSSGVDRPNTFGQDCWMCPKIHVILALQEKCWDFKHSKKLNCVSKDQRQQKKIRLGVIDKYK